MAIVASLACDNCSKQPAETWQILQSGQHEFLVDLCSDCARPLREFRRMGRKLKKDGEPRRRVGLTKSITYGDE